VEGWKLREYPALIKKKKIKTTDAKSSRQMWMFICAQLQTYNVLLPVLNFFWINLHCNFLIPLYAMGLFRENFQSTLRIKIKRHFWMGLKSEKGSII
jgi:hypothetical protein